MLDGCAATQLLQSCLFETIGILPRVAKAQPWAEISERLQRCLSFRTVSTARWYRPHGTSTIVSELLKVYQYLIWTWAAMDHDTQELNSYPFPGRTTTS